MSDIELMTAGPRAVGTTDVRAGAAALIASGLVLAPVGGMLLAAAGVVGIPAFLDVTLAQNVTPLLFGAGVLSVGGSLYRHVGALGPEMR